MQVLRWLALPLGVLSILLWLASYSWVVGVTPPTQWISRTASPWFVAEIAAAGAGALSLIAGSVVARWSTREARRIPICAAALGGFVTAMSLLSIAMPA